MDGDTYTLARFNVTVDCSLCPCPAGQGPSVDYEPFPDAEVCAYLTMECDSCFACCESPWPYRVDIPICWCIPEPGSAVLLALGAFVVHRWRV